MKNILIRLLLFFASMAMLFSAWVLWQNDRMAASIRKGELVLNSFDAIESLPPLGSEPLRQALYMQSNVSTIDLAITLEVANLYVIRRPLDAQGWLWKSTFHQRAGDIQSAKESLAVAHNLSVKNVPMLLNVFNRYVELDLVDQAMTVAKDLSFAQPSRFRKVFYLMGRLSDDYRQVVARVIPAQVPEPKRGYNAYDKGMYYRWALNDAIRSQNLELAAAVWGATPSELRKKSDFGLKYLDYLGEQQQVRQFTQVWLDHSGEELVVGNMPEQRFQGENLACWKVLPVKNGAAETNLVKSESEVTLKIDFAGEENVNYYHASCMFLVEAGKKYRIKGRWSGQDITTLAGPYLDVHSPSVNGSLKKSEAMIGSWPWLGFKIDFEAQNGGEIMILRLRRAKTTYLDSKISGSVSFKGVTLDLIEPEAQ